ncbi:MAG: protein phosphatase [Deltaproteobacteria bacterium]|nr:protein phosphatase [Deltaproteobacteria bacterium]HCH61570.1 protein phosphatase [Deltaproteobacteria bacterium]
MLFESWGASDVGQARKANEDAFLLEQELGLLAVADGMGGFQRGDVASQLAVNVLKEVVSSERAVIELYRRTPTTSARAAVRAMLEDAFQRACEEVHHAAVAITGEGGRMGTTLDVLLIIGRTAFVAHVGDGRIYLQRGREVHQLTEDHSLVAEKVREGLMTQEEARRAKFKNVITRALGVFPSVSVDTLHFELDPGDRLLLCSDGLYRYLGLRELGFTLMGEVTGSTPSELVGIANQRGGRDNITAVLALVGESGQAERFVPATAQMDVLRKCGLFQYCTYRELMRVCQIAEQRDILQGAILFRDGDVGRECYIVVSGRMVIEKHDTMLATLHPGHYFGEMSFLDHQFRSATARALDDARLLVLRKDAFLQLMKQDSDLAVKLTWQLLRKLSQIVREMNEQAVAETVNMESLLPAFDLPSGD